MRNNKRQGFLKTRTCKRCFLLLAVAGTVFASSFTAWAEEEDRTPIGTVSLDIVSSIEVGDVGSDVEVTTDSDECYVANVDVINENNDEWGHKDKPKVEISLEAERDFYFKSGFNKKKFSITGSKGTITSVRRKSAEEVRVVVTLNALKATDSDYELGIDEAEWNQLNGAAGWSDAEDAKTYELRLYRDGKFVTTVQPGKQTSCDLARYIKTAGTYTFEVRGIYNSSRKGEWQESDSFDVSAELAAELSEGAAYKPSGSGPAAGTWKNDAIGWWYSNSDGTYVTNNWQQIDGYWYFFDENGYRKTGWIFWNHHWYYLCDNGAMLSNAVTPDGKMVGADGALIQ